LIYRIFDLHQFGNNKSLDNLAQKRRNPVYGHLKCIFQYHNIAFSGQSSKPKESISPHGYDSGESNPMVQSGFSNDIKD